MTRAHQSTTERTGLAQRQVVVERDRVPVRADARAPARRGVLQRLGGVLSSDGSMRTQPYAAKRTGVRHAQCWSHTRRRFGQHGTASRRRRTGAGADPRAVRERGDGPQGLKCAAKLAFRCARGPLAKALKYPLDSEAGLSVHRSDDAARSTAQLAVRLG